jgi:hypothetical protein
MTKFLKCFFPYIRLRILMAIFIYYQTSANLVLPNFIARIINRGIPDKNTKAIFHNYLILNLQERFEFLKF